MGGVVVLDIDGDQLITDEIRFPLDQSSPTPDSAPVIAEVADFLAQVDAGRWPERDPRAVVQSITGM